MTTPVYLRVLLVAGLGMVSVGCAAGVEAPVAATAAVPEGRALCSNLQLDIPKGWTLESVGQARWRLLPPQASSYEGWLVCTKRDGPDLTTDAIVSENAQHLGWSATVLPEAGAAIKHVAFTDGPIAGMGSFNIYCKQYALDDERFETCWWTDPYPRRQQRADGYIGERWSALDEVAVAQRNELAASVTRSFYIHPTPERPHDQHP
ncbi:hypothetical protein [Stenotrophomonas sp. Iso1]|uniref:hypothetical protein n=1 Tax=Stenotrophomonas sp. Iso1 TaxID=2977283 RepID=UPI0022B7B7E5|nr:hypothetical protein [Stenotrophomonas sp. Iso1]